MTVTAVGRFTRDHEINTVKDKLVLKNSIAVNNAGKESGKMVTGYIDVEVWGNQAEILEKYTSKGSEISFSGDLQQQRWEKDGNKQSKFVLVVNRLTLIGGKANSGDSESANSKSTDPTGAPSSVDEEENNPFAR